jgi:hypothetical protein
MLFDTLQWWSFIDEWKWLLIGAAGDSDNVRQPDPFVAVKDVPSWCLSGEWDVCIAINFPRGVAVTGTYNP